MTTARTIGVTAAAFVVSQILAVIVHGFLLASDYAPFYGTLLRSVDGGGSWQMLLLPVSHLWFISALVLVYKPCSWKDRRWLAASRLAWSAGWPDKCRSGCCSTPSSRGRAISSSSNLATSWSRRWRSG